MDDSLLESAARCLDSQSVRGLGFPSPVMSMNVGDSLSTWSSTVNRCQCASWPAELRYGVLARPSVSTSLQPSRLKSDEGKKFVGRVRVLAGEVAFVARELHVLALLLRFGDALRRIDLVAFGSYTEIKENFGQGRWEPSELNGGKFCEVTFRLLEWHTSTPAHSYTAFGTKPRFWPSQEKV